MKQKIRIAISFLLVTGFIFSNIQMTRACGPFTLYAAFSYDKHPDLPFENFTRGELGILKPGFARSYLVVAYRYLNGIGLNPQEQTAVLKVWHERLGMVETQASDGITEWLAARKKVAGVSEITDLTIEREASKDSYSYYSNCLPDAFSNAAQILNERINKFGANNMDVKEWVEAQDKVFSNCSQGQNIPNDAPANASAVIKSDRAYQIAAAYFYSQNFDEAKTRFERISNDSSSSYNAVSALLVARAMIRKASLSNDEVTKKNALTQAEVQLKKVLANRNILSLHPSAQRLLSIVSYRLRPVERLHELTRNLSSKTSNPSIKQDLWDYTMLLDSVVYEKNDTPPEGQTQIPYNEATKDDLTDWLFTFGNGEKGFDHAFEKWQQTQSQAWLVAALTNAKGNNPKALNLIQVAENIGATPAYYHINYHISRLQLEMGKKDDARKRIDTRVLGRTNPSGVSLDKHPSTLNQFLSLRMSLATNLDEFLKYAQRKPAGFVWDYDGNELPDKDDETSKSEPNQILFDYDATTYFNQHFPLALLQASAQNNQLSAHLRKRLAIAALTRAVILEREDVGKSVAQTLSQLEPALKPLLDKYLSATTSAERKSAGLYLILKTPAITPYIASGIGRTSALSEIDSYRDNWWCGEVPKVYSYIDGEPVEMGNFPTLDFITEMQKLSAVNDITKLISLGTAPNYLPQQAVAFGQRSPNDPRVPEALHLAVKSTRYGCTDENTGKYSKAAFDFLHKNYKNSTWAKQTPYWFKGN